MDHLVLISTTIAIAVGVTRLYDWVKRLNFIKKPDPLKHDCFCYMERAIKYLIPGMEIPDAHKGKKNRKVIKVKIDIMRILLTYKFTTFREEVYKYLSLHNKQGTIDDMLDLMSDIILTYRSKSIEAITKKYNYEIAKLLDRKFHTVHKSTIKVLVDSVKEIMLSTAINGVREKRMAELNILKFAMQKTFIDMEKTAPLLNGELTRAVNKFLKGAKR